MDLLETLHQVVRRALLARGVASRFETVCGQRVHCYTLAGSGKGPPVVLVHCRQGVQEGVPPDSPAPPPSRQPPVMLVHFRRSFDELNSVELQLAQLRLSDFLEPTTSYLSVIELGLYESTIKAYRDLKDRGIEAHSEEWKREIADVLARQKEAMHPRLFPELPKHRYVSFYPMDRRRGEVKNWYTLPIEERARQMNEHGLVGRRYAGEVRQIITGSIGFDDWEWGVDLFANDPLVFKKLIYEMRFDEVSAVYALFGQFYLGVRVPAAGLGKLLSGVLPAA